MTRTKLKQAPKAPSMHDLKEYRMVDGKPRLMKTVIYNVPYGTCKGMKNRVELAPHLPQTFWKIEPNKTKSTVV